MARPRTPKTPKPPRIESVPEDFLRYSDLPTEFLNNFRKNITSSVAFVKKDGSVRTMAFRKRLLSYSELRSTDPKSEKETNILPNNNMFRGYDVNLYNKALVEYNGDSVKASAKAYRQFFLDNVLAIMSGGKVYDFREKNKVMERFGPDVYNTLSSSMINALKNDIQSAQSESGETLQENFKNMKKKINLNQFKNLVKRIIKEERDNLKNKKTIRITESQLRNQVRKMLREGFNSNYYDEGEDEYSSSSVNGSLTIEDLPNNDVLDIKFTGGWVRGKYSPDIDWHIEKAILYTDKGEMEINIYEPKYAELLKIADDAISDYLDGEGIRY
jgi:hypothetical protein